MRLHDGAQGNVLPFEDRTHDKSKSLLTSGANPLAPSSALSAHMLLLDG